MADNDTPTEETLTPDQLRAMAAALAADSEAFRVALNASMTPAQQAFAKAREDKTRASGAAWLGEQRRAVAEQIRESRRQRNGQ